MLLLLNGGEAEYISPLFPSRDDKEEFGMLFGELLRPAPKSLSNISRLDQQRFITY